MEVESGQLEVEFAWFQLQFIILKKGRGKKKEAEDCCSRRVREQERMISVEDNDLEAKDVSLGALWSIPPLW